MENIRGSEDLAVNELITAIDNNIDYFDKTEKFQTLKTNLLNLKNSFGKCAKSVAIIEGFAHEYDFDDETSGNGYRSFVNIFESADKKTTKISKRLITNRSSFLFRADNYAKYNVQ